MKTIDITEKGKKLCDFVTEKTMQGDLSNNDLGFKTPIHSFII